MSELFELIKHQKNDQVLDFIRRDPKCIDKGIKDNDLHYSITCISIDKSRMFINRNIHYRHYSL